MKKKQHWETIYADQSPLEVSWFQKKPELSLQLINHSDAGTDAVIIDVGGGASTLIDHLLMDGYSHLAVLDISENALQHTKSRLGDRSKRIEWIVCDVTEFKPSRTVDIWHDRAVFHFLTEQSDRNQYLRALNKSLHPDSQLIIAAFAIGGPTRCSGLEIVQYDADKMQAELGSEFQLVEQCSENHITPSSASQAFNYYRFRYRPA